MQKRQSSKQAIAAVGVLAACWVLALPGSAAALTNEEITHYKGADRTKVLFEGAKKEGKFVIYTALAIDATLRPLKAAFEKKYPGVKFEFTRTRTPEALQKATAEVRARNNYADLIEGGGMAMPAIKGGLVQSFISPSLDDYDKTTYDPNGMWAPSRVQYSGTAYNTQLIPANDVPKTYDDLLDPKWKGKMAWSTAAESGVYLFIATLQADRGVKGADEYLGKLAKQNMINDPAGLIASSAKVGRGEYHMAVHIPAQAPIQQNKKGAPVDVKMFEPVTSIVNTIQLVKGAPHPHAAMLYLDWILGKEGQELLNSTGYLAIHPGVEPLPSLRKIIPRAAKLKQYFATPEKAFENRARAVEAYKRFF